MSLLLSGENYLSGWLGDSVVFEALSASAEIAAMLRFEAELALAEADCGAIPREVAEHIASVCGNFQPDMAQLRDGVIRDGVVVPAFVAQLRRAVGDPYASHLHFGATSQDVLDTAFVLRLGSMLERFDNGLALIDEALGDLDSRYGTNALMAYTRMRAALPITVSDRLKTWRVPLQDYRAALDPLRSRLMTLQFAGPSGTLDKLGAQGPAIRSRLAERLGLADPGGPWHVGRARWLELGAWLAGTASALGKIGADAGLMAQDGIGALRVGGGSSSSMPHKVNPVDAELLVAQASHCATLLGGLHQAGVHEYERSGAAWTLEWLSLPPMLIATVSSLNAASRLLASVEKIGDSNADV